MEPQNQSRALGFLLSGFSGSREVQFLLFGLFLALYLATVLGNLLIILSIGTDRHLHTPMYFFLAHLSWADISFVSTTVLKMLDNIRTQNPAISYGGCLSQIFFFIIFGCLDNLLLTVMAYDRCVAICHPLHYTAIMHPQLCGLLVLGCWGLSVLASLLETLPVLRLAFCTHLDIPHFFCDLPQVLKLACSDSLLNHVVVYATTALLGVVPFNAILVSYYRIVSAILRISSAGARSKAFSTCASHLLVVSLFYGTGLGVYLSSAATVSSTLNMVASVMYTMVTPMLNPFIYSLRNKEIREALGRLWHRLVPLQSGIKLSRRT